MAFEYRLALEEFFKGWDNPNSMEHPVDQAIAKLIGAFKQAYKEDKANKKLAKTATKIDVSSEEYTTIGTLRNLVHSSPIGEQLSSLKEKFSGDERLRLEKAEALLSDEPSNVQFSNSARAFGCYAGRRWEHGLDHLSTLAEWVVISYLIRSMDSAIFTSTAILSAAAVGYLRYDRAHGNGTIDTKVHRKLDEDLGALRTWMHKESHLHYLLGSIIAVRVMEKSKIVRSLLPEWLPQAGAMATTGVAGGIAGHYFSTPIPKKTKGENYD